MIFRTKRLSTTQFDDFRLPWETMTLLWRNAIPCVTKKKVFILVECVYSWVQVVLIYDFKEMGDILKTSGAPWWPHEKVTSVHRLFSVSPAHHSSATPQPSNTLLPWRCHWWGSIWTSNPVWCCRSPSGPETHTPSVQRHYDVSVQLCVCEETCIFSVIMFSVSFQHWHLEENIFFHISLSRDYFV